MPLALPAPPPYTVSCAALRRGVSFEVRPGVTAALRLDQNGRLLIRHTSAKAGYSIRTEVIDCLTEYEEQAIVADFNFDGRRDVAVPSGVGYGGVNHFYQVYFYRPLSQQFQKSGLTDLINNPKLDAQSQTVDGEYKSGPGYVAETLCLTPDGLELYKCRRGQVNARTFTEVVNDYDWTWYGPSGKVVATRPLRRTGENGSLWNVVPSRLPLHAAPSSGSPAAAYVVRGDQVEVLELRGDRETGWAHVSYRGRGDRISSGWVRRSALR